MDLPELRHAASEIFDSALRSVDSGEAVRRAVRLKGSRLAILDRSIDLASCSSGIYAVAIGKAALPMAMALEDVLGRHLREGLIAGPVADQPAGPTLAAPQRKYLTAWRWCEGGHPLPNKTSLLAAEESFGLLERANAAQAPLIFLISGGGSAMIEWPRNEQITLADLRAANQLLVSCGAKIAEINAVRRVFSAVKGGGLSQRAPRCDQLTLIISDTNPGDEAAVASGPTIPPPADAPEAAQVVARYPTLANLPASILATILARTAQSQPSASRSTQGPSLRKDYVLLSNGTALKAAAETARQRGFHTEIAYDVIEQPVAEGCQLLLSRLQKLRRSAPNHEAVCLISGGEFACPVRGDGRGGRNAETVLRCAIEIDRTSADSAAKQEHVVVLSAGTDGIDGNSPAAGAVAEGTTIARAGTLGLNAKTFLKTSNAFEFFDKLGDALVTGPTGTNVRDVRILLASGRGN